MLFTASLYIALAVFVVGVLFKVSTWFRYNLETDREDRTVSKRVSAAANGMLSTVFSEKILTLLNVFMILFQVRELLGLGGMILIKDMRDVPQSRNSVKKL